jgi:DNA topoisomerase-1
MGTVTAFEYLSRQEKASSQRQLTRVLNTCLDAVAAHLGNTRAVCKKYYVHPAVFRAYQNNRLQRFLDKQIEEAAYFSETEQHVRALLARPN